MLASLLAQAAEIPDFVRPTIDWHALAPELTLLGVGALVTLVDVVYLERGKRITPTLAGIGLLAVLIPIITLAVDGTASSPRQAFTADNPIFSEVYVVDGYALILKALFIVIAYLVVLMSTNYIAEGDYWEAEYYGMLLSSVLGMMVMASARDLITVFVALELLSIPAYLMATWRKRDLRSNEAGLKYYLNGVFASALMLYGMSLLFGVSGSTVLVAINESIDGPGSTALVSLGIVLVIVGFAFKVSVVPFHLWAPDTYEGAPTPVTAFLAVAAKGAGFVALMNLIFVGFWSRSDVYAPALWILAALTMTVGNLTALRQNNLIRLMAYSGVAQAGFMLAALAVAGENADVAFPDSVHAVTIGARADIWTPANMADAPGADHHVVVGDLQPVGAHSAIAGLPEVHDEIRLALAGMAPACTSATDRVLDLVVPEAIAAAEQAATVAIIAVAHRGVDG